MYQISNFSCSNTDVMLILLNYFDELNNNTIFRTLHHDIILQQIYESIGLKMCKAILGFHAISGCDQTGKLYRISKLSSWKVFVSSNDEIITALTNLGESVSKPTGIDVKGLEMFVLHLYCKKLPLKIKNLEDLRWYLFSKKQSEAQNLPPANAALLQEILRAHYTVFQWKSSHLSSPVLPDLVGTGMMKHRILNE